MENIFFDSWDSVIRTICISIMAYFTLLFLLRSSGKRTLSKMNAFDFIVTVALGSCLANVALSKDVALFDGALVFFLLIFLQFFITWLSVRVKFIKRIITSRPTMLMYKGEINPQAMKKERITIEDIHLTARQQGISSMEDIELVVLETTGSLTILTELKKENSQIVEGIKKI